MKNPKRPPFPARSTIRNIRNGTGSRSNIVYAALYGPDDELLIAATLDYIVKQIEIAGVMGESTE